MGDVHEPKGFDERLTDDPFRHAHRRAAQLRGLRQELPHDVQLLVVGRRAHRRPRDRLTLRRRRAVVSH